MPVQKVFSVYDAKVEAFMAPFFCVTTGQAVRMFSDAIQDEKTNFCKHPEDFALFELGTFDDAGGQLHSNATAKHVITALELAKKE